MDICYKVILGTINSDTHPAVFCELPQPYCAVKELLGITVVRATQ